MAQVVDWSALGQTVVAAFLAGVGVALAFSLCILGAARLTDSSRELGLFGVLGFGALAILGMAAALAAIAVGIVVMTSG